MNLSTEERDELITGIKRGFEDVTHFGKFLDAFIQSVRYRAQHPIDVVDVMLKDIAGDIGSPYLHDVLSIDRIPSLRRTWDDWAKRNRVRGQTISNLTAVCVEIHLQTGKYFAKGQGTNDLKRRKDGSRWEIKGNRGKKFRLTINQSHKGIDETFFVVYCGKPELNELNGIFVLEGRDGYFTPRKPGLNLRSVMKEYLDKAIQIFPQYH